jgi:hypothetical protein
MRDHGPLHGAIPDSLFVNRQMSTSLDLVFDLGKFGLHPLRDGFALELEPPVLGLPAMRHMDPLDPFRWVALLPGPVDTGALAAAPERLGNMRRSTSWVPLGRVGLLEARIQAP